ncbi:hypothetical protein GCM10009837_62870 [Streptomyces durmitorensis]
MVSGSGKPRMTRGDPRREAHRRGGTLRRTGRQPLGHDAVEEPRERHQRPGTLDFVDLARPAGKPQPEDCVVRAG